jgi:hypothetical protein
MFDFNIAEGGLRFGSAGGSHILWPVVVWHNAGTRPLLAISVRALASDEPVVSVFEDRDP